ncbi:MAG TPA: hypothetical protein VEH62_03300 [Gemmatimonadales bacterium]|nr:hypothetical protein [Gemmatimonadales bacterium]
MRASSAVLTDTSTRLWELDFPRGRVLLGRTRAPYVALDSLIAFSKRDRDGKVDAYLAAYLPDEVVLLFFLGGELVNAAELTSGGRRTIALGDALRRVGAGAERAEIAFHQAPPELLAAIYGSCTQAPLAIPIDAKNPDTIFAALLERQWTGLLELISNGRVNYLAVTAGKVATFHFSAQKPDEQPLAYLARLFTSTPPEPLPTVVVRLYDAPAPLPVQAPPAMIAMFRHYVWDLTDLIEGEAPGEGTKRAERVRQRLLPKHGVLQFVGGARGAAQPDPVVDPAALAEGVAAWTRELLSELEVLAPQSAPRLVRQSGREHRFALNAVGFFDRLPWRVQW